MLGRASSAGEIFPVPGAWPNLNVYRWDDPTCLRANHKRGGYLFPNIYPNICLWFRWISSFLVSISFSGVEFATRIGVALSRGGRKRFSRFTSERTIYHVALPQLTMVLSLLVLFTRLDFQSVLLRLRDQFNPNSANSFPTTNTGKTMPLSRVMQFADFFSSTGCGHCRIFVGLCHVWRFSRYETWRPRTFID